MSQPAPQPRSCQLCFGNPCTCCPQCCRPRGDNTIIPPCSCRVIGIGDLVTVWFGDEPAKLAGKIVAIIVAGEAFRVKLTTRGEDLSDAYDWIVGEEFDMWRLKRLQDASYDDYFWSPKDEQVPP